MSALVALLAFTAMWCLLPPRHPVLHRISDLPHPESHTGQLAPVEHAREHNRPASLIEDERRRFVICAIACASLGWLLGGLLAGIAGIPCGVLLSWWVGRLETPSAARARKQIMRDLPLAVDLLAACAYVGRPVDSSLGIVSRAVGGALADKLQPIMARLALGADPLTEWRRVAADPTLAPLARTMARTLESGAPLAVGLSRLAADRRRERRTATQLVARNVGVKAAGPLAACFLPAFMLIGVVPTIAGAFTNLIR